MYNGQPEREVMDEDNKICEGGTKIERVSACK
jgi:hypothetical protein